MRNYPPSLHLGATLEKAKAVCVFVHGRGQTPEMMQDHVISRLQTPDIAYVLPRAASGSWYQARAVDALTTATSLQLKQSLDQLSSIMDDPALQSLPILLAGFSQGACVVIEYALKSGPWRGALTSLTGCRVGIASDDRPTTNLANMPAYLSNGDNDPWIPMSNWNDAVADLKQCGANLRTDIFPGRGHEVSDREIAVLDFMLSNLTKAKPALP